MTWQEFGALGEVVGGIAAVVLLGYIAYQIRQNSRLLEQSARATQASIYQASSQFWAHGWSLLAQDSTLAQIWQRGRSGEVLEEGELVRFEALLTVMFSYADDAATQSALGTYDVDIFELGGAFILEILSSPLALRWWRQNAHLFFRPEFCSSIEELLERHPLKETK